jgi:chloramphenicol-sensitive protein RarD
MVNKGILLAFCAYFFWGLVPLYWKLLQHVPAIQLIGHRVAWSCILLLLALLVSKRLSEVRRMASDRKVLRIHLIAAILLGCNWFIFVWSVNAGYVVEASLGYFITPLFAVMLGVVFLKERLRFYQWTAVGLAAAGVLYLTIAYGCPPWIALGLAFTFGVYGLIKKTSFLNSVYGLAVETGMLFFPALLFLVYQDWHGRGAFLRTGAGSDLLMISAGLVTTVPLLMYASAARRIPLTTVGIMHYITPTCQFLLGVLVYQESFTADKAIGFCFVWIGLVIFGIEGFLFQYRHPAMPKADKNRSGEKRNSNIRERFPGIPG